MDLFYLVSLCSSALDHQKPVDRFAWRVPLCYRHRHRRAHLCRCFRQPDVRYTTWYHSFPFGRSTEILDTEAHHY